MGVWSDYNGLSPNSKLCDCFGDEMFAYLASNGQDLLRPIAEVHVEVYTKEAYNSLMQYLANSGMDITIKSTKLKRWK